MISFATLPPWSTLGLRTGVIAGSLIIWFWTQSLIARKAGQKDGLGDVIHDLTAGCHHHLTTHPRAANLLLIGSSLGIDFIGVGLIAISILGTTFAPFLAILIVFILRQVSQGLCTLPPPPGIIWRNPGCPSLLVTYKVGNDFFFSGHTALAILGAITAAQMGPLWLALLVGWIALGEMLAVLVLRAHYTLDVISGIFAAFFAAHVASLVAPSIDRWVR